MRELVDPSEADNFTALPELVKEQIRSEIVCRSKTRTRGLHKLSAFDQIIPQVAGRDRTILEYRTRKRAFAKNDVLETAVRESRIEKRSTTHIGFIKDTIKKSHVNSKYFFEIC